MNHKIWEGACPHCDLKMACYCDSESAILLTTIDGLVAAFISLLYQIPLIPHEPWNWPTYQAMAQQHYKDGFPESIPDSYFAVNSTWVPGSRPGVIINRKTISETKCPKCKGFLVTTLEPALVAGENVFNQSGHERRG